MTETQNTEMPKAYEPGKVEQKWYKFWMETGLLHAENRPGEEAVHHHHAAAERHRRAARRPRPDRHAGRYHDPLAPHEGRPDALAAGRRPCRHRHAGGGGKGAGQRRT